MKEVKETGGKDTGRGKKKGREEVVSEVRKMKTEVKGRRREREI